MSFKLNLEGLNSFLNYKDEINKLQPRIKNIHEKFSQDLELKNKFLGWLDLPLISDEQRTEIEKMKYLKKINQDLDVLVVIGIGGSYLGARAGIEFLSTPFQKNKPEIIFAGHQVSGNYLTNLIKYLKNKKWAINVISKSGATLEPALAFRVLKKEIENQFGKEQSKKLIFVTTDKNKGILLDIANKEGYEKFIVPDSVGGRFSVLTAVGLLPFVFANLDVDKILEGAADALQDNASDNLQNNLAYQYAAVRYLLHTKMNKKIELMVTYQPHLISFSKWWEQLFAESEGKDDKGLFVSTISNSSDLHSLGQFIQEGSKIMFETILNVTTIKDDYVVPVIEKDVDRLNDIAGIHFDEINQKILKATKEAHIEGHVPNIEMSISNLDEYHLGYLFLFFQKTCAMSGYLLGINPFNQDGVEVYKKKMNSLLGRI